MINEIKNFKEIIRNRFAKATLKDYTFPRIIRNSMISMDSGLVYEESTPKMRDIVIS